MKKRLQIIIVLVIGLAILAFAIIWAQLNSPSVGKIRTKNTANEAPKQATWTRLEGKQFSLEYFSDYVSKQSELHNGKDNYFFVEDGLVTKHLGVAVADISGHSLAEEPAYQMRALAPETYKRTLRNINGQKIEVMEKLDHTEQVAFIAKGNRLGTIALTTGDPSNPPVDELNHMIASWIWK